jgi:hypothetical protein
MECTLWNWSKKCQLWRLKREQPAPVDADVWVWMYRGTVYSTKGTTWSGSPLWKEAQQEVRQHWFIDSYIAAYIQVQYRVIGVHPTGLTVARGVSRCPQACSSQRLFLVFALALPRSWAGLSSAKLRALYWHIAIAIAIGPRQGAPPNQLTGVLALGPLGQGGGLTGAMLYATSSSPPVTKEWNFRAAVTD